MLKVQIWLILISFSLDIFWFFFHYILCIYIHTYTHTHTHTHIYGRHISKVSWWEKQKKEVRNCCNLSLSLRSERTLCEYVIITIFPGTCVIIFSFKYAHFQTYNWYRCELSVWWSLSHVLPHGLFFLVVIITFIPLICKFSVSQYFTNVSISRTSTDNKIYAR